MRNIITIDDWIYYSLFYNRESIADLIKESLNSDKYTDIFNSVTYFDSFKKFQNQ